MDMSQTDLSAVRCAIFCVPILSKFFADFKRVNISRLIFTLLKSAKNVLKIGKKKIMTFKLPQITLPPKSTNFWTIFSLVELNKNTKCQSIVKQSNVLPGIHTVIFVSIKGPTKKFFFFFRFYSTKYETCHQLKKKSISVRSKS